jgi:Protein of unknown function (DUF5663)
LVIKLDTDLLVELGYGSLTEQQAEQLLRAIYDTGEILVGTNLAQKMKDPQLDEFERFIDSSDDVGAVAWLERNFPDYKQTVQSVFEKLFDDLRTVTSAKANETEVTGSRDEYEQDGQA